MCCNVFFLALAPCRCLSLFNLALATGILAARVRRRVARAAEKSTPRLRSECTASARTLTNRRCSSACSSGEFAST
eukprot:626451-Pyramimonas_sp.AAC.1